MAQIPGRTFGPLSRIDLLVNNAGIAPRERMDILEATQASFDELFATNLKGPYFITQAIARSMLGRGSGTDCVRRIDLKFRRIGESRRLLYDEGGYQHGSEVVCARLAPHNIPVFEIEPGIIRTDMIASVAVSYEKRIAGGLLPQRRMGEPQDVAKAVRAIADGQLDYSTGQVCT